MGYIVFATIAVKPEHFDDACAAVDAIIVDTRAETGCEAFEPYKAQDGSPEIHIYERWADRVAFDFHHAQPYTKDVFAKYQDWLAAEPKLVEMAELKG